MRNRLVKLLRRAGYLAFIALTSTALAELALRGMYREPWYESLVRSQAEGERYAYPTNELGLRDRPLPPPGSKSDAVRRVLFLGDSFTFGSGVRDERAPFPRLVERWLNGPGQAVIRPPGVGRIDVLNGGIGGSLPAQWLNLLDRVSDRYDPDVIVVVFFLRDGTRLSSMNHFFGPVREEIVERNAGDPWYGRSYIYRLLRDRYDRDRVATLYTRALHRAYFGNEHATAQWRRAQESLRAIFRFASARDVPLAFVVFPVMAELQAPVYPFERICSLLVRFASNEGVSALNLLEAFRASGNDGPELWVAPSDQHPNDAGHRIAAGALGPLVASLLWTAEGQNPPARLRRLLRAEAAGTVTRR